MPHSLPNKPSISLLRKQAKKLLKQVRDANPEALAAVNTHHPKPAVIASLRDAQLVIARRYGFAAWSELACAVQLAQDAEKTLADKAALFVQLGCVQYSGNDLLRNYQRAQSLLSAHPEIATFSFYTALVAKDATAVKNFLASDPALATSTGGVFEWPALLYVCYSRIDEPENTQHALSIVKQLLEHGASADSHIILNDTYRFTALTGAMGEGEQAINQPPHQHADQLVAQLLEAGANPNDGQGLYNTIFSDSVDKWLAVLMAKGLNKHHLLNWNADKDDATITTLDYQLASAVDSNRPARARLLLNAGANPNARSSYNGKAIHTNALLAGYTEVAQLLEANGAVAEALDFKEQLMLACVNDDQHTIATLLNAHPTLKEDGTLLYAAAETASMQTVLNLIAQGFDINGQSQHGRTLLHHFALSNDTEKIKELLKLGARTDIRDSSYKSLAVGFAAYSASYESMRLLLNASNSLIDCVCCAYIARAKAIVEEQPSSIVEKTELGNTALHIIGYWLHDEPEYDTYKAMVKWLVSAGADIHAKNKQGQTPLEFNVANGYETLAEVLAELG